jgi:two-component system OmpR family sensor kinase
VLLLGLAAGALIAGQIAGPLRRLDRAAERAGEGDLSVRAKVEGSEEQRSLAATFNQMTARLDRLVAGQREFVADASHQLRTPLSGLRLRLEEAQAISRDDAVREEIDGALTEVDRLAAMVSELLLLSQAGEADAPAEDVDLGAAARRAAERFPDRVKPMSIAGGRSVRCAPADLDRALDVLIENALHYGGGVPGVVIDARSIAVVDDGPGLDPDEIEEVFERFHRGRAGRGGPAGTGLGLPNARDLMRRWGAEVTLENRDEGGAVARISFDGT